MVASKIANMKQGDNQHSGIPLTSSQAASKIADMKQGDNQHTSIDVTSQEKAARRLRLGNMKQGDNGNVQICTSQSEAAGRRCRRHTEQMWSLATALLTTLANQNDEIVAAQFVAIDTMRR